MKSTGFPITVVQGEDFNWPITYKDQDGDAVDLTGYTAAMQIRKTPLSEDPPIVDLTTENGGISIDGENGIITIIISNSITASLDAPLKCKYDLFIISPASFKTRLIFGIANIEERVTQ